MSYVIAAPDVIAAATTDLAGIGSTIKAANAVAALPTSEVSQRPISETLSGPINSEGAGT